MKGPLSAATMFLHKNLWRHTLFKISSTHLLRNIGHPSPPPHDGNLWVCSHHVQVAGDKGSGSGFATLRASAGVVPGFCGGGSVSSGTANLHPQRKLVSSPRSRSASCPPPVSELNPSPKQNTEQNLGACAGTYLIQPIVFAPL